DPVHRRRPVGLILPAAAKSAARAADCVHAWARLRACYRLHGRHHARLWPCRQPAAPCCGGHPAIDAAGVPAVDGAQLPADIGHIGAGARDRAVSADLTAAHRRRHPDQRRNRRHHRLWRALVAGKGARMSEFFGSPHALLVLVLAGFLPNEVWRMAGLWFGAGVDEGSEVLVWVRAVATAILAGVIAQILMQPPGALADVPDLLRYGAVAAGFAVFMLTRRSIFAGVVCGEIVLLAGKWWLGLLQPTDNPLLSAGGNQRKNKMNWLKLSALACALVCAAPHAHAAEYPTRPIK